MISLKVLAAVTMLATTGSAKASDSCRPAIKPGRSIGPVRLGMSVEELRGVATIKPLAERTLSAQLDDGSQLGVRLDAKMKVEHLRLETSKVCVVSGSGQPMDLKTLRSQTNPFGFKCNRLAMGPGVEDDAKGIWRCEQTGIDYFWDGETTGASVFAAVPMSPYLIAPAPMPVPPKPVKRCEQLESGEEKCVELPPVDPCAGNFAPMPEMACGFFGRNDGLALQCYLTHLCMGTFDPKAVGRVEVWGEDGSQLGIMSAWHEGRTLRYAFGKAPRVGAKMRVLIDGTAAVLPPESSLQNPAVSPDEARARAAAAGRPVPVALRNVVGARRLPGGFVLDLKVPRSAIKDAAGSGKAAQ